MAKGKYQDWLEPDKLLLLAAWARDGLTYEQIARNMGISESTFRDWRNKYPAVSAAIKKGKEIADIEVENALHKAACGYEVEEITKEAMRDPGTGMVLLDDNGESILAVTKTVKKFVAPNPTAIIYWTFNRMPKKWRQKQKDEESDANAMRLMESLIEVLKQ